MQLFKDEIQRVGDAAGLEGEFLVHYGTDNIIEAINGNRLDIDRAIEMLNIAAEYIRTHWPDGTVFYDETDCDGYCVADDCKTAAESLITHHP